jgi:hypothetical protein
VTYPWPPLSCLDPLAEVIEYSRKFLMGIRRSSAARYIHLAIIYWYGKVRRKVYKVNLPPHCPLTIPSAKILM